MNSEKPLEPQDSESQNLASESVENQGLQEPEIEISGKDRTLTFEQINEVTWKLTDGRGTNAWDGYRGGYRTTRAVAWLVGVGDGKWIVRYRNKASRPTKLNAAKRYALEMVKGVRPGVTISDPIANLNRLQTPIERKAWPTTKQMQRPVIDLTDAPSSLVAEVVRIECEPPTVFAHDEPLQSDDYQLEYYEGGYPKRPDCLKQ